MTPFPLRGGAVAGAASGIGAAQQGTSAEAAPARIGRGLLRRGERVLIGRHTRQVASMQRLFPVDCRRAMERLVARQSAASRKTRLETDMADLRPVLNALRQLGSSFHGNLRIPRGDADSA